MNDMQNILIALIVMFLLVALVAIPFLVQVWRTVREMATTLQILNRDLPAIMKNLGEISTNINRTTTTVHREVAELSLTLRKVQGVVGIFLGVADVLAHRMKSPLARSVTNSLALFKGIRAFIGVLAEKGPGNGP
jgi:uncharacterized protein YoxC